ncbi:MAG TPA: prephenate dehydratase domain-containing protein [Clostridia bacterium]|nr:prephenate dehydratase domain-containing protein [Clostridia bacterium]
MSDLDELRKAIDEIDSRLIGLYNERMRLAEKIAHVKSVSNDSIYKPGREQEVIRRAADKSLREYKLGAESFFSTITRISRGVQYEITVENWEYGNMLNSRINRASKVARVACQGVSGAYSFLAAQALFCDAQIIGYPSFSTACEAVHEGRCDVCVLPLENSTEGTVNEVYDQILKRKLYILKSITIPIRHCLAGKKGTRLENILRVISHPQALAQCMERIAEHGWETVNAPNTAVAAQQVANGADRAIAAIASAQAAGEYGLEILIDDLSDNKLNTTRFVVLGKEIEIDPAADRVSVAFTLPHISGSLASAIGGFSDYGLNLAKIQSRPIPDKPWEYCFYLDFMARPRDRRALAALYRLEKETPYFSFLGWYPELTL